MMPKNDRVPLSPEINPMFRARLTSRSASMALLTALATTLTACDAAKPPGIAAEPQAAELIPTPPALDATTGMTITVTLMPTRGNTAAGRLVLSTDGKGIHITGSVRGLQPNSVHGIHIHENGDCTAPDASSAGAHFNPLGHPHGAPGANSHVGDLGNITANSRGIALVDLRAIQATLRASAPTDIFGRAIIVHAGADDMISQPSGESGARIACGTIA